MEKNNRKIINAWCSYDIANSAYNLIITTVLFPLYYQEVTSSAFKEGINLFGLILMPQVLYIYTIAAAYLIVIILSPLLSGIADYGGYRKRFMQFFTLVGSISCMVLFWFHGQNIALGLIAAGFAVIGFAGSLVFYNSFLPIIATPDMHDRISAKGFSWGYAGSMLLLIINLFTIMNYKLFHFEKEIYALKFSFLEVGIWWFGIACIAFYYLKDYPGKKNNNGNILAKGYSELLLVFKQVKQNKNISIFLVAFFFLSMGVQTVVLVASLFGTAELGISGSKLIITIIIIQIVGILGSMLFAEVSVRKGNKFSIFVMLIIWILVCASAYFVKTFAEFNIVAAFVGLVMGGIQSQSRSTFAKLIPENSTDTASFFSFYDVTEKAAVVLGMFSFGLINQVTGNMRNGTLSLTLFFIIAAVILSFAKLKHIEYKKI